MKKYDVIVIGGGFSGCAAALAAARGGCRVMLAEKSGFLGGATGNFLVNPFMPYTMNLYDENGEKQKSPDDTDMMLTLNSGIFTEILERLEKDKIYGYGIYDNPMTPGDLCVMFSEESLKILLDRMMEESGVDVLLHADLCDVKVDNGKVESVTFCAFGDKYSFSADVFIDTTGDANLAYMCGAETKTGRDGDSMCQPMTLCFRMNHVDIATFKNELPTLNMKFRELKAAGKIRNYRENILAFANVSPDILHLNSTRIVKLNPCDPFSVSIAEREGREQALELFEFLKQNAKSCRNADLIMTAPMVGCRESRMIVGDYTLTADDVREGRKFADGIAACNYFMDIHNPDGSGYGRGGGSVKRGDYYTIPYRSLCPVGFDNMLVAGRCVSATHEAQSSLRIMPTCASIGEAAGTAASILISDRVGTHDIDSVKLRKTLMKNGAFVGDVNTDT